MARIRERLGVGNTYFAAMKNKMGKKGDRFGLISDFWQFMQENPKFRQGDVYRRKSKNLVGSV